MAGQGNYVSVGSINNSWGQGLSSSLSDLSKSFLAQASEAKDREELARREAESARRFGLEHQRALTNDEEARRQFELGYGQTVRLNDSNLATAAQNRRIKEAEERDRLAQLQADRATNESLYNANAQKFSLSQYPEVQQTAYNRILDSVDKERMAAQAFVTNPTEANRLNVLEASKNRYALTDLGKGAANTKADQFVQRLSGYLLDTGNDSGLDMEGSNNLLDQLYSDDYLRMHDSITSGNALPLRERVLAFAETLPREVRQNLSMEELTKRYQSVTGAKSRQDLQTSAQSATEQSYQDVLKQAEMYDKYYQRLASGSKGGSKPNIGLDSVNFKAMLEDDIGPYDNEDRLNAYVALRENPDITPEGAAAAIASMTDSNIFGTSFPDTGDNEELGDELERRAIEYSTKGSGNFYKIDKDDYKLSRPSSKSLEELLVGSISFAPSKGQNIPVSALYDTDLIRNQTRAYNAANVENFRPSLEAESKQEQKVQTSNDQTYVRPSGNLSDLKAMLKTAQEEHMNNLRLDKEDREVPSKDTFNKVKDLKEKIRLQEFSDRRIKEINSDINATAALLDRPGISEGQKSQYQSRIKKLKEELKQHTPK